MDESLTPDVNGLSEAEEHQLKLAALRREIDRGIASLEAGQGIPGDEAFRDLYSELNGLAALRHEIDKGYADIDAGRVSPKDEVFTRLRARHRRPP